MHITLLATKTNACIKRVKAALRARTPRCPVGTGQSPSVCPDGHGPFPAESSGHGAAAPHRAPPCRGRCPPRGSAQRRPRVCFLRIFPLALRLCQPVPGTFIEAETMFSPPPCESGIFIFQVLS